MSQEAAGGICDYFTACESAIVATSVHAAAPLLLVCVATRFVAPAVVDRSSVQQVLLSFCVLLDGTAAALPLLSNIVPGMITLTGQVSAVSGAAAWSAACALLLMQFSVEHALDCSSAIVLWALSDTFGGALSIADAACGGIGAKGVLWRSAGAICVLLSLATRLVLILLLLAPRFEAVDSQAADDQMDVGDDDRSCSAANDEDTARHGAVVWGDEGLLPVLGNAMEHSGWLAQLFMTWPGRMLSAARVRALFHGDISKAPAETHPALSVDAFFLLWARRSWDTRHALSTAVTCTTSGLHRLGWILWKIHGESFGMALALRLLSLALRLAGLLMVAQLLIPSERTLADTPHAVRQDMLHQVTVPTDGWKEQKVVGALVACLVLSALFGVQGLLYVAVEQTKMRNLLWAVLYRTAVMHPVHAPAPCAQRYGGALHIDTACRSLAAAGALVEAAVELLGGCLALHLAIPLWGAAAGVILVCGTAVGVGLVLAPALRPRRWLQLRACHAQRVAASEELLNGILALKYLGWEHAMAQRVVVLRRRERRALSSLLSLDSISRAVCDGGGLVAAGLLSLSLLPKTIFSWPQTISPPSPASFFSGLGIVTLMWWRIRTVPRYVWAMQRAWHALDRLDCALMPRHASHPGLSRLSILPPSPAQLPQTNAAGSVAGGSMSEGETGRQETGSQEQRNVMVRLDNVTVGWQVSPDAGPGAGVTLGERLPKVWRVLQNVTLRVRAGDRVGVVGGAGSGKTSLLMGLLGEACILPGDSLLPHATPATSVVCRPMVMATARPWVDECLSVQVNVISWERRDAQILCQTLELCGLRPEGASWSVTDLPSNLPSKRHLDRRCSGLAWPEELRQRVGLARAIYAAALACQAVSEGKRCVLLLDEPLCCVRPAEARGQEVQRILRSRLLTNAAIILTCRDTTISQGVDRVLLLRASRAIVVAPPAMRLDAGGGFVGPSSTSDTRNPSAITPATDSHHAPGPTIWNPQGQDGQDDSYMLLDESLEQHMDGSHDTSRTPSSSNSPSTSSSSLRARTARPGESVGGAEGDGAGNGGVWGQWQMLDTRPHASSSVCPCSWTSAHLEEAKPTAHQHAAPHQDATAHPHLLDHLVPCARGVSQQAHVGRVLLQLLHGHHKTKNEWVAASWSPACLVLLHGLGAALCVCAPYVLALLYGGTSRYSPAPIAHADISFTSQVGTEGWIKRMQWSSNTTPDGALTCPAWTPCWSNCSVRVAEQWEAVSARSAAGESGIFVAVYLAMLASAALVAFVGAVSGLASTALPSTSALPFFRRSSWRGSSRLRWSAASSADTWSVDEDDVISRLLLRATGAACAALLKPGMLDKIKCALRLVETEGDVDGVPGALDVAQASTGRQAVGAVLAHLTCLLVSISCMLVVWPALALPVSLMVMWVARVAGDVERSQGHLHTICRAPACARHDRLWVALRNGVDLRACHAGKEAEEGALYQGLCLEAAAHVSLVGAQLMLMLRIDFLGIALTCLPAVVTTLSALSMRSSNTPDTPELVLDQWLLVAMAVVQGLWCWAHCHAILLAWRGLSQVIPGEWRLQHLSHLLPDEQVYRARTPAANATHHATDAILSALQKRGLTETWRNVCASNNHPHLIRSSSLVPAAAARGEGVSHATRPSGQRSATPLPLAVHEVELDGVQLADGLLTLGPDGGYTACNGFTEPLRARLRAGALLWVGGGAVLCEMGAAQSRHGLAAVLGGWGDVAAGRVLVAGDDVALLPLSEVRRQIVVVPRQALVVSGTVRHNLDLLGKAQGDWEIWAALEQTLFADTVRSWPGKLDCVVEAGHCGNVLCGAMNAQTPATCCCHDELHALPSLPNADQTHAPAAAGTTAAGRRGDVHSMSQHQRQLLGLTRAILTCALNGSRVLVVEGLDELVDKQTQQMLMDRQLALGMTTVLISRHHLPHQAPPVLHIPGALAILVNPDGTTRHWVGRAPSSSAAGNAWSGLSETSDNDITRDNDHYEPYRTDDVTSDSNCDSDAKPNVSPLKKKRSVAGHAGKVLKDGFKGIGKAGRLFGRTVAYAPSLLPSVSSFSS